ncbi:MAG: hypothetical protein HYR75_00815 [Gemmatimonadetes bacterium]|nr:hypothetical protein [Gemmatimonadota bacterium]MBI3569471.1 hypothetical protein [Gemmatimonadota bacterium]
MLPPQPYALETPPFPFRALAALAAKAPLGGARETALATLIASRLIVGALAPLSLPAPARRQRADAAKVWLSAVALPAPVRTAIARLVELSASDDLESIAQGVTKVTEVTAPYLDRHARLELERLAARLGE